MAKYFLSTAYPLCLLETQTYVYHPIKCSVKRQLTICKAVNQPVKHPPILTKRDLSISFLTTFVLSLAGEDANGAILEADDDVELLEKVKKDRKKRLEKQGVISSSTKETGLSCKNNILLFPALLGECGCTLTSLHKDDR